MYTISEIVYKSTHKKQIIKKIENNISFYQGAIAEEVVSEELSSLPDMCFIKLPL